MEFFPDRGKIKGMGGKPRQSACDITVRVGGEAGQGMQTVGALLGKLFVRRGSWVFTHHDIMSRIRGGHSFSQTRISDRPVRCPSSEVDVLVCLDKNTYGLYHESVQGAVIVDGEKLGKDGKAGTKDILLPLGKIAKETGGDARMANSVACGAVLALLGDPLDPLLDLLAETYSGKGEAVVRGNKESARAGYTRVKEGRRADALCRLGKAGGGPGRMLLTGSEAMAMGALAAGIGFYSAYPMSPSTPILEFLAARRKDFGLVVEQAEDEISAVNMAIGASFCGARAMTGTSGGGLALMVEGTSLAGMTETPLVLVDCQRPAPATGLPTRTEQADLLFVAHGVHGEFPKAVLAPSTAEEAFHLVRKAFDLAETYQTTVFVLGDQFLNDSSWTVEPVDGSPEPVGRRGMLGEAELKKLPDYGYRRYEITDSGVSPRILPGTPRQVVYADSDEHTEEGHITESAEVRTRMVAKRLRKLGGLRREMSPPKIYPDDGAALYSVSWGSTLGAVTEAVETLRGEGHDVGLIHFSEILPLPENAIPGKILGRAKLVAVENNATAQLAALLRMEAGIEIEDRILKYDGRPFTPEEIADGLKKVRG
jgi:2-oxoglutarate ferredoxin oxidoreductase subunit alpha